MTRPSTRRSLAPRLRFESLEDRALPAINATSDAVLRWHDVLMAACVTDNAVGYASEQGGPTRGARAMAIVSAAVYDAVNSIDESYMPYLIDVAAAPGASINAAVARAAHDTLAAMFPKQTATFDAALVADIAALNLTTTAGGMVAGAAVGAEVAAKILAVRANDGSGVANVYTPGTGPLDWKPDPLHPAQKALTPDWGFVTPFTMNSGSQFRVPAPPDVNSPEYLAAYNEVKQYGGDGVTTPTLRTAEQTEIGLYWGYDGQPGLCTPPRLYNQIVAQIAQERGNTLVQNARLFALANLAMADAGVAAWEAKYFYNYARPVTLIREADLDGNPNTIADPTWRPLGAPADNGGGDNFTPPFPAYVSGHATFGGAVFETLRNFYGTDNISFTFLSDELNGKTIDQFGQVRAVRPRHFDTLSQAEEENGQSRIYLGIHWAYDKTYGIQMGNEIADQAFAKFLRARPAVQRHAVGADAGGAPRVVVLDGQGHTLFDFLAFDASFRGGVRVAMGDVTGDGVPDVIAAAGPGGAAHVKVFNGTNLAVVQSFFAYDPTFTGGVYVAAGDVDGDGRADVVTGAGEGGAAHVKVFSGATGATIRSFQAFDASFRGGVRVAAGDVDGDGLDDVVAAAGPGGGSHVKVFSGATGAVLQSFFAFDPGFTGGVYVAAGDCDANGRADVIAGAGAGGGPQVKVFDPAGKVIQNFFAFAPSTQSTRNGVRVGSADLDGDGRLDILTGAGPGDAPLVECRNAMDLEQLERTFAFEPGFRGGVFV